MGILLEGKHFALLPKPEEETVSSEESIERNILINF